jgi:predicted acyl esterase
MVQVQSTWFPLIDRNPQTFVPNIFEARAADFQKQTHRVYRASRLASHVTVPVVSP